MSRLCFYPCECGTKYKVLYQPTETRTVTTCQCGRNLSVSGKVMELYAQDFSNDSSTWTKIPVAERQGGPD
jgi:hypothetical protein